MKLIPKILAVVLILSGLMPLMAVFLSYSDQPKVMEMFQLRAAPTPETQTLMVMMGSALIFAAVIQFIAAIWIWKGKAEGLSLSFWVGIMLLAAAIFMLAALSKQGIPNSGFYIVDLVKGVLVLALTMAARNKP